MDSFVPGLFDRLMGDGGAAVRRRAAWRHACRWNN